MVFWTLLEGVMQRKEGGREGGKEREGGRERERGGVGGRGREGDTEREVLHF